MIGPWEEIKKEIFEGKSDDELQDNLELVLVRNEVKPNAFAERELKELSTLLELENKFSIEELRRHTNEFASYVGLSIYLERDMSSGERVSEIEIDLIKPVRKLLKKLRTPEGQTPPDFVKEFRAPWGKLNEFKIDPFLKQLENLEHLGKEHIKVIKGWGQKGKPWDSDLKHYFVSISDEFIAYLDPSFVPKRSYSDQEEGQFLDLVNLLSIPIWIENPNFSAAVKEHVANWNKAQNEMSPD